MAKEPLNHSWQPSTDHPFSLEPQGSEAQQKTPIPVKSVKTLIERFNDHEHMFSIETRDDSPRLGYPVHWIYSENRGD